MFLPDMPLALVANLRITALAHDVGRRGATMRREADNAEVRYVVKNSCATRLRKVMTRVTSETEAPCHQRVTAAGTKVKPLLMSAAVTVFVFWQGEF